MLHKYSSTASALSLALLFSGTANAEMEPILSVGLQGGGDELVNVDLNAGGGISLGAGMSFSQADSTLSYRIKLHVLFNAVELTDPDGAVLFYTFPLELGLFNRWNKHEFGGGLSYHFEPSYEFRYDRSFFDHSVNVDNATGLFLQYNYIFSQSESSTYGNDTYIGVKFTSIDYEIGNASVDASSLGIHVGSRF